MPPRLSKHLRSAPHPTSLVPHLCYLCLRPHPSIPADIPIHPSHDGFAIHSRPPVTSCECRLKTKSNPERDWRSCQWLIGPKHVPGVSPEQNIGIRSGRSFRRVLLTKALEFQSSTSGFEDIPYPRTDCKIQRRRMHTINGILQGQVEG